MTIRIVWKQERHDGVDAVVECGQRHFTVCCRWTGERHGCSAAEVLELSNEEGYLEGRCIWQDQSETDSLENVFQASLGAIERFVAQRHTRLQA